MFRKFRLSILFSSIALLLVTTLSSGVVVFAQGEGGGGSTRPPSGEEVAALSAAAPVPGGPGFYAQSALAFKPYKSSYQFDFSGSSLFNPGTSSGVYEAPVSLPNGATITKFVLYYLDNGSGNISAVLARGSFTANYGEQIAIVTSSGASASILSGEDTTVLTPLIDQQSYGYWIELFLPATDIYRVTGFRIDYTYGVSLPAVTR